ncbi:GIP [Symbiodinium sp. CCMP2592]|nr:GIP [Symbiodinium sp. CCMP2592]
MSRELRSPFTARMNMLLKAAHASERVLRLAKGLECETCAEWSRPKAHHVTKMRRATEFNQQVGVDTFELEVRDVKMHFLNIVDEATGFQMCVPLWKGMQAKNVRNSYRKNWKRWAGPPIRLFCDGGKEFEGEFEHGLSLDGTFELVDQINNAVNSMTRKDGYSPFQHVFGRDVRVPGLVSSDVDPVINSSLVQGESVFERRMELRTAARQAFLQADGDMRIRKAMEHRSRPERGPFTEGQLVFFWRKNRFDNRAHWHGPAVVIGKSGASKVWVARGTKVYRCCPEQLRGLSPDQEATVKLLPADMVHIRGQVSAKGAGNYHDLSMLERPQDHQAPEVRNPDNEPAGDQSQPVAVGGVGDLLDELEDPMQVSQESSEPAVDSAVPAVPRAATEAGDESPAKRARREPAPTQLTAMLRLDPEVLDGGRASSSGERATEPDAANIPVPGPDEDDDLEVLAVDGDKWIVDHRRSRLIRMHNVERQGLYVPKPSEFPVEATWVKRECCMVGHDRFGTKICCDYDWIGRNIPEVLIRGKFWTGYTEFYLENGWSVKELAPEECHEVNIKKGRKEPSESEIPKTRKTGLDQAKIKEWKKLTDSGAIKVHVGEAARKIRSALKAMFPFKHWKMKEGEFLGKTLQQQSDGSIRIHQREYAKQLKGLSLSRERRRELSESVSEEERRQLRGVLGAVNWLVSSSRPDVAAWCSLLQQRVCDATVSDLIEANKLVSFCHDNCNAHVWIRSIPMEQVQFTMLSDAAWANAQGCCSQAGYMIAACTDDLPAGRWGLFSVMRWRSYKQDRQTHSTLGAELLSLSRGLAEARWLRSMWCEARFPEYNLRADHVWSCKIPITAVIDCKPVYDHVEGPVIAVKDKRVAIEMMLVKEDISKYNISLRWMATKQMIVDVLTKRGAPMGLFRNIMQRGEFVLVEDKEVAAITSKR